EGQDRGTVTQVPPKAAGRGQVLGEIEAPRALLRVREVAVPGRLLRIRAVGQRGHRRNAGVGRPAHHTLPDLGVEAKGGVLVVERVEVTTREKRPDDQYAN